MQLGKDGVTVNTVPSGLLQQTDASSATSDEVFQIIRESTPLQKVTAPKEAAYAVLFFTSPWSPNVT
ncbi:SDR family oxidoreductase [Peribacillus sp. NPDC096540]|uniref:SDR family oxidoreductase n=1 Tax=Peribacillus sp. NPDC096540 TaxID=3390612 RepID=UPI003D0082D8